MKKGERAMAKTLHVVSDPMGERVAASRAALTRIFSRLLGPTEFADDADSLVVMGLLVDALARGGLQADVVNEVRRHTRGIMLAEVDAYMDVPIPYRLTAKGLEG